MELDFYVKQRSPLSFDSWDNNFVACDGCIIVENQRNR
jgi:hypothetical protein